MTGGSRGLLFVFLVVYTCDLPKPTLADNSPDPYITPRCKFARQNEKIDFMCCQSMRENDGSLHFTLTPSPTSNFDQSIVNDSCEKLTLNTSSLDNRSRLVTNVTCFKASQSPTGYSSSEGLLLLQDVLDVNINQTYNDTHVHLRWQSVPYTREYIVIVKKISSNETTSTSLEEMFFPRPCGNINIEIQVNISDVCIGLVYTGMHTFERTAMDLNTTSNFRIIFSDNNKISACLNVLTKMKPTNQKLCLEPYNITLLNSMNDTVHRDSRPWAEFRRTSGNDLTAEICIQPPKHNVHYTVQLEFDTDTLLKNFSTFDVQEVTVNSSVASELTICCKYARGSHAKGCHIKIRVQGKVIQKHDLLRSMNTIEDSCYTFKELEDSEYEILVWDIEDNSINLINQPVAWRDKIFMPAGSKPGGSAGTNTVVAVVLVVVVVLVAVLIGIVCYEIISILNATRTCMVSVPLTGVIVWRRCGKKCLTLDPETPSVSKNVSDGTETDGICKNKPNTISSVAINDDMHSVETKGRRRIRRQQH